MALSHLLRQAPGTLPIHEWTFGIEREGVRVTPKGLAQTPHPVRFGDRRFHPYIQTDFSEAQLEFITPAAASTKEARDFLSAIHDVARRTLADDEVIWPLSMPPAFEDNEIQIANLSDPWEKDYRQGLAKKYGKARQMISGIHLNMSLTPPLLDSLFALSGMRDKRRFANQLYTHLAQNFLRFQWLLTYLYGASPVAEAGFPGDEEIHRSMRTSRRFGYHNGDDVRISFRSLEDYVTSIEEAVADGRLSAEKEAYTPVRFRGQAKSRDYLTTGVSYLEFRSFDLDPFSPLGIQQETLDSIQLFVLALLWLDLPDDGDEGLAQARQLHETVALSHPLEALPDEADTHTILSAMQAVIQHFALPAYFQDRLATITQAIADPSQTIGGRLMAEMVDHSLASFARKMADTYQAEATAHPYRLSGFADMELSSQLLIADAIQKGVAMRVLDRRDQFLELRHGAHVEYVKNANMTSKDSYISPLIMANKSVTKTLLAEADLPVPPGQTFDDKAAAARYLALHQDKKLVVKPQSTNYGVGISLLEPYSDTASQEEALAIAFQEDTAILIEDFVPGTEYRFFVLDGECLAVLLRKPANVLGDGVHTIKELIARKNQDPMRGVDHRLPLEKIQMGEIEALMLDQQGLAFDSIPEVGQEVLLRGNSNISTGGDSIDVTDQIHASYKDLAIAITQVMGAWVCGVDLMIDGDPQEPGASCVAIECNFNPAMYLHTFTYQGEGQALTLPILYKLFPELDKSAH